MFGRTKTTHPNPSPVASAPSASNRKASPSVLAADISVLGNIISEGAIDINGRIDGNVKCESVTIREQGQVRGDVVAEAAHIYGKIEGLLKAKHVVLYATAHVTGIIMHESLSIEDGAFIDGKLKRTDKVFIEDDLPQLTDASDTTASKENMLENLRLISG